MQTIGKIINGKYVRYGAVSVGDKLGDAAFANIVNNATTTEEGFVPDARVVAQQQQIITQQQEQIDSLNSAINFSLYRTTINLSTNAYGNISLNKLDKDRKLWLLSAFCNNYIVLPYKINDYWECKIVSMNDGSKITPVVSTGVIVQCFWLEVN